MSDPALPQDLQSHIRALERRIVALERSPQIANASIKGGALTVYDASGNPVVILGNYTGDYHGLQVLDTSGNEILVAGEFEGATTDHIGARIQTSTGADLFFASESAGTPIPRHVTPWRQGPTADVVSTTSSSYVKVWESRIPEAYTLGIYTQFVVTLDAADEATIKVVRGGDATDEVVLDGSTATQWTVTLNWLHGLTRGTGPHTFEVQAKRSAGTTASVNIFEPSQGLTQQTGNGATSGGLTAA